MRRQRIVFLSVCEGNAPTGERFESAYPIASDTLPAVPLTESFENLIVGEVALMTLVRLFGKGLRRREWSARNKQGNYTGIESRDEWAEWPKANFLLVFLLVSLDMPRYNYFYFQ
jgi:hypothetical protein